MKLRIGQITLPQKDKLENLINDSQYQVLMNNITVICHNTRVVGNIIIHTLIAISDRCFDEIDIPILNKFGDVQELKDTKIIPYYSLQQDSSNKNWFFTKTSGSTYQD